MVDVLHEKKRDYLAVLFRKKLSWLSTTMQKQRAQITCKNCL